MVKLISEVTEELKYLVEETTPGVRKHQIEGVFLQSEKLNRNGRRYPRETMAREVARYTKNYINENRAFGELGHPDSPTINLDRVSHMVTSLSEDGTNWIGRAKILDTPYGKIVKSLIDEGAKLGVSSRGLGSLHKINGVDVVGDDFFLATAADIVADPSAPDAFVRGIVEGKEWVLESSGWKEVDYEQAKKAIVEAKRKDFEEVAITQFERFISRISKS